MNKRGISPIIATMLLVLIAIIIAAIIFVWAKSFLNEKTLKFDQAIELSCDDVNFQAEAFVTASESKVDIVNVGNIPIYGIEISKSGLGSITKVGTFPKTISNGETGSVDITDSPVASGDTITITPILIGTQGEAKKAYPCEGSKSAQTITVQG